MSTKRQPLTDMRAIKMSRGAYTGVITKLKDTGVITKLKDKLTTMQAKDVSSYNIRILERAIMSINNAEVGFQQTMEDAQDLLDDGEVEVPEVNETTTWETFSEHALEAQDLADEMLTLKRIQEGLRNLKCDATALRDSFDAHPVLAQDTAVQALNSVFTTLRKDMGKSLAPSDHHLRKELDAFSSVLTQLTAEIATSKARSAPAMPLVSFASKEPYEETCRIPKLDIPTFNGDIMKWASFWAQFEASIDSHERLSDVRKLAYLWKAITDPDMLQSGAETRRLYSEVVAVLKLRFDHTREIHRNHCQRLTQFETVK